VDLVRIRSAARKVLRAPGAVPGYLPLLRRLSSRRVAVVMYHGVTADHLPVFNWCQLAVDRFEQQVAFLAAEYHVLPLAEVVERLRTGAALPDRPACITFDDGFRNVLTTAFPILERCGMPATVFLVTSLVGTRQPAWPEQVYQAVTTTSQSTVTFRGKDWLLTSDAERSRAQASITEELKSLPERQKQESLATLMTTLGAGAPVESSSPLATLDWNEVDALSRSGLVDFGSHTHTHPILARCSEDTQFDELRRSRDVLNEHVGRVSLFAYPNGTRSDFTSVTKRLVGEAGYQCALSTVPGLNTRRTDAFELRRVNVGADMTLAGFEAAMIGL
jgi:peptidoglycan/xylan/chitin deacetylase (PgdA/CDA1 family)